MLLRIFALLLLLTACSDQGRYPQRNPPAGMLADSMVIAAGRQTFADHCASCHGHLGEGRSPRADFFSPPAPDFLADRYRHIDPAYLYWRIETGKTVEPYLSRGSVMPAWGPYYDAAAIWQLVAYLRWRAEAGTP